jgi:hypothetical protein
MPSFGSLGSILHFEPCQKNLGVSLAVIFVPMPILVMNGYNEGSRIYGEPLRVCIMHLGLEPGDEVYSAIILRHKVKYGKCEFTIAHMVSFQVTEGVV